MKTAFDNLEIHIPANTCLAGRQHKTFANCDNVSGIPGSGLRRDQALKREFPDRLTMASTGGPVTGNDDQDKLGWQSNTRKLEAAEPWESNTACLAPRGEMARMAT
jgi:hypothetical protein